MTIPTLFNKILTDGSSERGRSKSPLSANNQNESHTNTNARTVPRPGSSDKHPNEHKTKRGGQQKMEIIKKTNNITAADLFAMTKGPEVRKMQDAKGETLDLLAYVIYKDDKNDADPVTVLAVKTVEGAMYATNSKTFIRNFSDILAMYEECGEELPTRYKVGSARSNAGREYLTCTVG